MRLRTTIPMLLLATAFAVVPAVSPAAWVTPTGEPAGPARVRTWAVDAQRIGVAVELPGFLTEDVAVDGRLFARLRVPGASVTLEAGVPELPFLPVNLALPAQGTPTVRVVGEIWREVATLPILPSRGNLMRDRDPATAPWRFGPVYTDGGVYPSTVVTTGRPYLVRGRRGVGLRIHPLRWDVGRDVLLVLERLELEVETAGTGGVNVSSGGAPASIAGYTAHWSRRFANAATSDKYRALPVGGRLLVVAAEGFETALMPFVQWKRQRGFDVEVATATALGGTAEAIAAAVAVRYHEPAGLGYVILAGDVPDVPTFAGVYEGADDDTRYALVDGDDLYPDLFVSRISARDETELLTQLNKFIRYERDPEPDGDWYPHAMGIASILGDPSDAARADLLRTDLLGFTYGTVDRMYEPAATGAAITAALEDGRSLVNYLGHGSGTSWSNPPFDMNDVAALNNGPHHPLVLDVSCANGRFTTGESFVEAWLRAGTPENPQGAIAMFSASTSTPWVPPTLIQTEAIDLLAGGEALEIGALCQHGIMRVLDTYPGDVGRQLVEQYNIFGDATLLLRTARPLPLVVGHAGALAVGVPTFPVDVGVADATVTLTAPGVLLGVARSDGAGLAVVPLAAPPGEPGELILTVTGPNLLTHVETIPVRAPLAVTLDRDEVPLDTTTALTVALTDPEGFSGDVAVTIAGYGVPGATRTVAGTGAAVFDLHPVYGEDLVVTGRTVDGGWDLFRRTVPVSGAVALAAPGLDAAVPEVAMTGSLAPGAPGVLRGWSADLAPALAVSGCGLDTLIQASGDTTAAVLTPTTTGTLTVALLVPGRRVHVAEVPVIEVRGTVGGRVTGLDGEAGLHWARVQLFDAADTREPILDMITDELGRWWREDDLPAGTYELRVEHYGHLAEVTRHVLLHGDNVWDMALPSAPMVAVTGVVRDEASGEPLAAVLDIHRTDTGTIVATARADAAGLYTSVPLPEGEFIGVLTHPGHRPRTLAVSVELGGDPRVDVLGPLDARILVVADNLPMGVSFSYADKLDKNGDIVHYGSTTVPSQSGLTAIQDLLALGYDGTYLPWSIARDEDWFDWDVVMVACGDNPTSLADGLAERVRAHVARGGRLLLEGGEVAATHAADAAFCREVLHVARWGQDVVAPVVMDPHDHEVLAGPNRLFGAPLFATAGYASGDGVVPAADAVPIMGWPGGEVGVLGYDPDADPEGGQVIFMALDLSRLDAVPRHKLLQNAVEWLHQMTPANATITGRVRMTELPADLELTVGGEPGGYRGTVGRDGAFALTGLVAGPSTVTVGAAGWTSVVRQIDVRPAATTDVGVVVLAPAVTGEWCTGGAVIPDGDPIGLTSLRQVDAAGVVTSVRVHLDIDHPWPADLAADLTSPDGTTIRLRYGGAAAGPAAGWYPGEDGAPLAAFTGRTAAGTWLLRLTDMEDRDEGVLNGWCLELVHEDGTPDLPPAHLQVLGNRPNPFNPATTIIFAMPTAGEADVSVYDLRGRRVRRIIHRTEAPGRQEVVWSGRDDGDRALASGVYIVRITAAGERATAKMLLLR